MRTYRDLCGIARALDLVGERWALLVVRELLFGPKRFADLHRGLPGMSQNVLTQRLRELEDSGVLLRRRGLPPATGFVYELTDRGRALEPVLVALGRWGSPLAPGPHTATELSPDALVVALRTTFDPTAAVGLQATAQLRLPGDAFVLTVRGERFEAARGESSADATVDGSVGAIQELVFNGRPLSDAVAGGAVHVDGDVDLLARLLATFGRSVTVDGTSPDRGQDYESAWQGWEASGDEAAWSVTAADGVHQQR